MKLRDHMPQLNGATTWFNSNPVTRDQLLGDKPTLIHFWSISCEMCKEELPTVNEIRDENRDELNVIAVHMPRSKKDADLQQVKDIATKHNIVQPIFVDNEQKLTNAFKNKYVPAYYVFDVNGKLRHFQSGGDGLKMLRKRVERVIRKKR